MAGVLTHVGIMLAGILISFLIFRKVRYGIAFAIGHSVIDFLALGITGIRYWHISFYKIMDYPLFYTIGGYLHDYMLWMFVFIVIQVGITLLYFIKIKNRKIIDKKRLISFSIINLAFLIGLFIHIFIDARIFEKSIWV